MGGANKFPMNVIELFFFLQYFVLLFSIFTLYDLILNFSLVKTISQSEE